MQLSAFDGNNGWPVDAHPLMLVQQEAAVDRDAAANIARAATGGRVLAVEPGGSDKPVYNVKVLLPDGHVRVVIVDGASGDIL